MKAKNSRSNYFRELTGVRVVSMYVQEFFHWGWIKYDQENDDGIDGHIIIRDHGGKDLGAIIKVQIKSGPSYVSSRVGNKEVRISPFSSKESFKKHLSSYSQSDCPVVLVWVNTQKKDAKGKVYEDYYHPEAWWRRVDNYEYNDESVISLFNKFGEHSKGELFRLVKNHIKDWIGYPKITLEGRLKNHFFSSDLKQETYTFYREWRECNTILIWEKQNHKVKINRTGWRHINDYKRGRERINTSLRLLPLAREIITHSRTRPVLLQSRRITPTLVREQYGLRCRVLFGDQTMKVQVVLIRMKDELENDEQWRFYSIHVIK